MVIYPAIDLYAGKAVRLYKGDYNQMEVFSDQPLSVAEDFIAQGAQRVHLVDLEGARDGSTPNFQTVSDIKNTTGLFCEIGGGIRNMETVSRYLDSGIDRVILGTAAVENASFVEEAVRQYGNRIAVGVDIRDGFVAVKGWTEKTEYNALDFCRKMQNIGVKTIICTDISRDGAMRGTNRELYKTLEELLSIDVIASGGVSDMEDVKALRKLNIHGAIIGKAYYLNKISLREAIEVAQ